MVFMYSILEIQVFDTFYNNTFSMTSLASCTGLATLLTADTAPLARVLPSITIASISTSPFTFSTDPRPMIYGYNPSFLLILDVVLGIRHEI